MKSNTGKIIVSTAMILLFFAGVDKIQASEKLQRSVRLPEPERIGELPLVTVYMRGNYSDRIENKNFSIQDISNLLWCVFGIHRYGEGKKSKRPFQHWDNYFVYVSTNEGIFKYEPFENMLEAVNPASLRKSFAEFKKFPCQLILVIKADRDRKRYENFSREFCEDLNTGVIYEKIFLACAAQKWANRIHDPSRFNGIRNMLKIKDGEKVSFIQSVGYSIPLPPKPLEYPYYKGFSY